MGRVARFGVSIPQELADAFDERIQRRGYRTRSEAIRDIMREHLVNEAWESERGEVVGTVTIVYDHERRELTHILTELQHHFQGAVICSTHVHLDEHNCLEVIVLRGPVGEINKTAENIISLRGVKLGRINLLAAGVT